LFVFLLCFISLSVHFRVLFRAFFPIQKGGKEDSKAAALHDEYKRGWTEDAAASRRATPSLLCVRVFGAPLLLGNTRQSVMCARGKEERRKN
jgi:hypothetical protein